MSLEYDLYLNEHKMNVMGAFHWLTENIFDDPKDYDRYRLVRASRNIAKHDESKYGEEYAAYDEYFYGDKTTSGKTEEAFNYAWLIHIHDNPHHWQHWVLINDDPELGSVGLEMPYEYIIEMVCDWWSFSWKTGNLYEIFSWYEKNKNHMILHENTRKDVEDLLAKIKVKLDEMLAAVSEE